MADIVLTQHADDVREQRAAVVGETGVRNDGTGHDIQRVLQQRVRGNAQRVGDADHGLQAGFARAALDMPNLGTIIQES